MKIIVINSSVWATPTPGYSGLEMIAWHTAKGLAERGHQVAFISPEGSSCPGCQIIPCGPPGISEKVAYGGFNKPGEYGGYWQHLPHADCIIDHGWLKHSLQLKAEGVLKAPVLTVCHAPVNTMFQSMPPVEKACFVCISEDQKQHFEALYGRKAETCYNGIDLDYYKPLGIPRSDRFLFLARFSTIKGPDLAIDLAAATGVGLDLVGDTSITNEPEYFQQCKAKCDNRQIKMVGPATRGECVWWYSQAKAFWHLNLRFKEPFGLAPVEAQACGLPILTWDHGAMRETVEHGKTGFLVNSLDEAKDIVRSNALSDIDPTACRKQAEKFSIANMAARYEQLAIKAVNEGGW